MDAATLLTDMFGRLESIDWPAVLLIAVPVLLVAAVVFAARSPRPDRRVTFLATAIGLTWMAQGMWEAATTVYGVPDQLAGVLFVLFETFMLGNMLRANRFRTEYRRRAKPVRFVWSLAVIAGLVVALAEGWQQAPLRLVVPLLVAWNWYLDLTADDDPEKHARTTLRWTPHRLLLAVGAIEPGARDAVTIDRDRQVARIRDLAFAVDTGVPWLSDLFRRRARLARLEISADDEVIRLARADLARRGTVLAKVVPEPAKREPKPAKPASPADSDRRVQGVHVRDGQVLRGTDLKADALVLMRSSVSPGTPRGMTAAELAAHYDPPLKTRTSESFAAEARRRINGHALTSEEV